MLLCATYPQEQAAPHASCHSHCATTLVPMVLNLLLSCNFFGSMSIENIMALVSRAKNECDSDDMMPLITKHLKGINVTRVMQTDMDLLVADHEKLLVAVVEMSSKPSTKVTQRALEEVFKVEKGEAELYAGRLDKALQYCRLKAKGADNGKKLRPSVWKIGSILKVKGKTVKILSQHLLEGAKRLQEEIISPELPKKPRTTPNSKQSQSTDSSQGQSLTVDISSPSSKQKPKQKMNSRKAAIFASLGLSSEDESEASCLDKRPACWSPLVIDIDMEATPTPTRPKNSGAVKTRLKE